MDNDEKTFSIIIGKNGEKIYYLKANRKEDESSITWTSEDETTLFNLIGDLEKEELLNIQQNIKIKNNN